MKCNFAHTKASILSSTLRIFLTSKTSRCVQYKVAARKGIINAPVGMWCINYTILELLKRMNYNFGIIKSDDLEEDVRQ